MVAAVTIAPTATANTVAHDTTQTASSDELKALSTRASDAQESLEVVPGLTDSAVRDGIGVSVDTADQRVSVELESGKTLSTERVGGDATQSEQAGGNIILTDTETDTDTILQSHDNAARIIEVLNSADAPTTYSYDLDFPSGFDVLPQEDGSIVIGKEARTTDGKQVLEIEAMVGIPWAVDADGAPVPARYERNGDRLDMVLDPASDAEYPIVADPVITRGGFRVIYPTYPVIVQLNKARTADAEDVGSALCIGIGFVPIVGVYIAAACGLHNIAIRTTSRYGYCQRWSIRSVKSMTVGVYRGAWCR